jgi:hypothetical protein
MPRNFEAYRFGQSWIQYAERSLSRIHVWAQRVAGVKPRSSPGHDIITFCNHPVIVLTLAARDRRRRRGLRGPFQCCDCVSMLSDRDFENDHCRWTFFASQEGVQYSN